MGSKHFGINSNSHNARHNTCLLCAGAPPSLYERLRHLVYTSPYIDPDYVLTKLPPEKGHRAQVEMRSHRSEACTDKLVAQNLLRKRAAQVVMS
eukprot:1159272-Pelagomonas_calceolata.AAC.3